MAEETRAAAMFKAGDRVEKGEPGTEGYSTGAVVEAPTYMQETPHLADEVYVSWDDGIGTYAQVGDLRHFGGGRQ